MQILFSDDKLFPIDSVYNFENDRVCTSSRAKINKNGEVMPRRKFTEKGMAPARKPSHHWCCSRKAHLAIIGI